MLKSKAACPTPVGSKMRNHNQKLFHVLQTKKKEGSEDDKASREGARKRMKRDT